MGGEGEPSSLAVPGARATVAALRPGVGHAAFLAAFLSVWVPFARIRFINSTLLVARFDVRRNPVRWGAASYPD